MDHKKNTTLHYNQIPKNKLIGAEKKNPLYYKAAKNKTKLAFDLVCCHGD